MKDLRVLKTTQSAFVNFVQDEYRTLPDAHDRVFSTVVSARWQYSSNDVDYCSVWYHHILPFFVVKNKNK